MDVSFLLRTGTVRSGIGSALDCFSWRRVKTLLAFATKLFEINLKRNLSLVQVSRDPRLPVLNLRNPFHSNLFLALAQPLC